MKRKGERASAGDGRWKKMSDGGKERMIFTHKYASYTCTEGSAVGDDECDDDEQKNKLIFIFYRYVSSNERVSYSLTPEYIYFFSLFFPSLSFCRSIQWLQTYFPMCTISICIAVRSMVWLSISISFAFVASFPSADTASQNVLYTFMPKRFVCAMHARWLVVVVVAVEFSVILFHFVSFLSVLKRFSCSIQSFSWIDSHYCFACICICVCVFCFLTVCVREWVPFPLLDLWWFYMYGKLP